MLPSRTVRTNRLLRRAVPALALMLAACGTSTDPRTGDVPAELKALPRALTAPEQQVVSSANDFAFALFKKVSGAQRDSNVFISPVSASMALGMTMNGAANQTFDQMRSALSFGSASQQSINDGYKGLIGLLRGLDASTTFQLANSIWYRQEFPFEQSFLETGRSYFDAEIRGMDFASPTALPTINGWVSDHTNGKIPKILDAITDDQVMFLINAIYFKGSWRNRFDPAQTRDAPFHAAGGVTQTAKLMHRAGDQKLLIGGNADYQFAELPYGNGAWAMTIVLPSEGKDVEAIAQSLDAAAWASITSGLHERTGVDVYLPKFRLEYTRTLNDDLKALGMIDAFAAADFTRMSASRGLDLYIQFVKQKTFVDVNEEGTEAAAATAVGIGLTSASPNFVVDRPFIFAIRERLSGTILFMGKIVRIP